jgi:Cys-rich four helix bundle protein (predicted Tat secretion target)
MERRHLLQASAAAAFAAATARAAAPSPANPQGPLHHPHHEALRHQALADAAGACLGKGEACLAHCLVLIGGGDTSLAACAQSVNQLLATCTALQKLALQDSRHVRRMAALAMDLCEDCEKECRKHADQHAQCRECAEACVECHKACKAAA